MMDCKRALEEAGGDLEKAVDVLRKKGAAKADTRAGREASEGLVDAYIHFNGRGGVLVEVNCETDFVARTEDFKQLVRDVALHIASAKPLAVRAAGWTSGPSPAPLASSRRWRHWGGSSVSWWAAATSCAARPRASRGWTASRLTTWGCWRR